MVLLTHRDGVCVFDGGTLHEGAFSGFTLEGRTGRGDTCTASFLVARGRGMGLAEAAAFAARGHFPQDAVPRSLSRVTRRPSAFTIL